MIFIFNMNKKIEAKVLEEVHPFNEEEVSEIFKNILKDIRPYLDVLDKFRANSLDSNIILT